LKTRKRVAPHLLAVTGARPASLTGTRRRSRPDKKGWAGGRMGGEIDLQWQRAKRGQGKAAETK